MIRHDALVEHDSWASSFLRTFALHSRLFRPNGPVRLDAEKGGPAEAIAIRLPESGLQFGC